MSLYFSLQFSIEISSLIDEFSRDVMDYIFMDSIKIPSQLPKHAFFFEVQNIKPLRERYSEFPKGQFFSEKWYNNLENSTGISANIPRIKDSQEYYEMLLLVDWVCTFSIEDGYVGAIWKEEDKSSVDLLFSKDGKLCLLQCSDGIRQAQTVIP